MKSFDEFVKWLEENGMLNDESIKMYPIYLEGYLNGYEQRGRDDFIENEE